ncbi:MAG: sugar phosphate isomerase/epimerase family protein [Fuerstiella sp.]
MPVSRRTFFASSAVAASSTILPANSSGSVALPAASGVPGKEAVGQFRYCLNTSTIRGQTEDIVQQIEIASTAGYDAIEPWIRHIEKYVQDGGSLADLKKRIDDAGLTVESAIGFAKWIVDDEAERQAGLETAKRDMNMLANIGGKRIAAPPIGAHRNSDQLDPFVMAERYGELLKVGDITGVVPQLEVWGFSDNLSRLGESVMVCVESGHPKACLLPDVYHIFKGGSPFTGLDLLADDAVHVFHMNDYPATPVREKMNDSDRVYPGDGVAPLAEILNMISSPNRSMVLSLELFNKEYWKQDADVVAKTGLEKMKAAVAGMK